MQRGYDSAFDGSWRPVGDFDDPMGEPTLAGFGSSSGWRRARECSCVAQRSLFKRQPESAQKLIAQGGPPTAENLQPVELNPIELAAATVVAQTILNLDATVWKR